MVFTPSIHKVGMRIISDIYNQCAVKPDEFKSGANMLAIADGIANEMSGSYKTAFSAYSQLICDTAVKAINARAKEKASPSITNVILNKIK